MLDRTKFDILEASRTHNSLELAAIACLFRILRVLIVDEQAISTVKRVCCDNRPRIWPVPYSHDGHLGWVLPCIEYAAWLVRELPCLSF
jgi:hypothetical protein